MKWHERLANDAGRLSLEERRKAMPQTAEIVGWFQEEFGQLKSIQAQEGKWTFFWEQK